jgi:hypothetical protein
MQLYNLSAVLDDLDHISDLLETGVVVVFDVGSEELEELVGEVVLKDDLTVLSLL